MSEKVEAKAPVGAADVHPLARLPEDWSRWLAEFGQPRFRGEQIFRWLQRHGVTDVDGMTNVGRAVSGHLASLLRDLSDSVDCVHRAPDGTRKLVFSMHAGARVESVLIPMTRAAEEQDADIASLDDSETDEEVPQQRVTLCVSTQFGCAMGCVFCASGRIGLLRGLSAGEIVTQVQTARKYLEPGEVLRNLVFMGMGEPLQHYDQTARALRVLTHAAGLDMSPRRITVSTVGLVPGIRRLGEDFAGKVGLAVSLHAPNDELRSRIVPMNRRYPLKELMAALREYPLPRRRRITIEYTLIDGVNDDEQHARELVSLLRDLPVKVNLIPMNEVDGLEWRASSTKRVEAFREILCERRLSCFVRTRRGDAVSAACGQLAMRQGAGDRD